MSFSRSGEPRWDTVTESSTRPSWASSVEWAKADLLKPESYKPFLNGATAVVHSMGILLEADYKGVVQGREPIIGGLQRAFSSSKLGSQDTLSRKEGEALEPKEKDGQLTYELMNRDSGMDPLSSRTRTKRLVRWQADSVWWTSYCTRPRIFFPARSSFRVHIRCGGRTGPSSSIHYH